MNGIQYQQSKFQYLFIALTGLVILFVLVVRTGINLHPGQMDEYDYLFVGKLLLSGENWPTHTYIFGSNLNWYILGLGESLFGGLEGARILSGLFGICSVAGMYYLSYRIFASHHIAFYASLLLSMQATHVIISQLATYDILCFTWFVFSLALLLHANQCSTGITVKLIIGALLLSIAIASKYVILMYFPVIVCLIAFKSIKNSLVVLCVSGGLLAVYGLSIAEELAVLYQNQLLAVHGDNATYSKIFEISYSYLIVPFVCTILLLLLMLVNRSSYLRSHRYSVVLCLILSLPVLLYHTYSQNMIALYKHVNFSLLFLLPISAFTVVHVSKNLSEKLPQAILIPLFFIGYGVVNYTQLVSLKKEYPDVSGVLESVKNQEKYVESILSEDPYLFRYVMFSQLGQNRISESGWLDNDLDGVTGTQDVKDALWDRKYDLVYLNDQTHPAHNKEYRKILSMRGYQKVFQQNYHFKGLITANKQGQQSLYRRAGSSSADEQPGDTNDDLSEFSEDD